LIFFVLPLNKTKKKTMDLLDVLRILLFIVCIAAAVAHGLHQAFKCYWKVTRKDGHRSSEFKLGCADNSSSSSTPSSDTPSPPQMVIGEETNLIEKE
jgi:hypothetical protein